MTTMTTFNPSAIRTPEIQEIACELRDLRACADAQFTKGDLVSFAQINAEVIKTERRLAVAISAEIARQAKARR